MAFQFDLGLGIDVVGGLVLLGFAGFAYSVAPQARANRAFLFFAGTFGVAVITGSIANMFAPTDAPRVWLTGIAFAAWAGALLGVIRLAFVYPSTLLPSEVQTARITFAVLSVTTALALLPNVTGATDFFRNEGLTGTLLLFVTARTVTSATAILFMGVAGLLMVLRHATTEDPVVRRSIRVMCVALIPYAHYLFGVAVLADAPWVRPFGFLGVALALAISALWLRESWRNRAPAAARGIAWFSLAMILVGMALIMYYDGNLLVAVDAGLGGITRLVAVGTLTYGVLRYQILDIETKLRWTISRSSLAGVFVATFFVASEGAQVFFGDRFQSEYLGVAAAGLLVLAIAPLQRVADRLAARAVPEQERTTGGVTVQAEAAYLGAVRAALHGDGISRREELHLADVADHLGISARRALELRSEVEGVSP